MVAFKKNEKRAEEKPAEPAVQASVLSARRVYFVGAHSTGKTTLARWTSRVYGLPLIPEVARTVLDEMGTTLDRVRLSPDLADMFQWRVFDGQLDAENKMQFGRFVSDRACDHIAYASEYSDMACRIFIDPRFQSYMHSLRYAAAVFFVRPHKELVTADGIRTALDWDSIVRIDGMTKLLLKIHAVPFIELAAREMDSRVSTIRAVLGVPRG